MTDSVSVLLSQLAATSLWEWLAVVTAIAYVWLAARQNSWFWVSAFVSTAIYTWLFWQVTLPFQSALNLFYMVMAVYGYLQWGKQDNDGHRVRSWPWWLHALLVPSMLLLAWGLSILAASQFHSDYLLLDASIHLLSVLTTFMVAHKILQNWVYWFFINLASAYLFAQTGLVLSACLFVGYVGFSVYGYRQWNQQWKRQHASRIDQESVNPAV